jgi:hypothetical protein
MDNGLIDEPLENKRRVATVMRPCTRLFPGGGNTYPKLHVAIRNSARRAHGDLARQDPPIDYLQQIHGVDVCFAPAFCTFASARAKSATRCLGKHSPRLWHRGKFSGVITTPSGMGAIGGAARKGAAAFPP